MAICVSRSTVQLRNAGTEWLRFARGDTSFVADTAIFDVDGTLVDTNYQHAVAFYRAFRRYDITLPMWRLHRATGMGGDQIVAHVAGDEVERRHGSALREAWVEEFDKMIDE